MRKSAIGMEYGSGLTFTPNRLTDRFAKVRDGRRLEPVGIIDVSLPTAFRAEEKKTFCFAKLAVHYSRLNPKSAFVIFYTRAAFSGKSKHLFSVRRWRFGRI